MLSTMTGFVPPRLVPRGLRSAASGGVHGLRHGSAVSHKEGWQGWGSEVPTECVRSAAAALIIAARGEIQIRERCRRVSDRTAHIMLADEVEDWTSRRLLTSSTAADFMGAMI